MYIRWMFLCIVIVWRPNSSYSRTRRHKITATISLRGSRRCCSCEASLHPHPSDTVFLHLGWNQVETGYFTSSSWVIFAHVVCFTASASVLLYGSQSWMLFESQKIHFSIKSLSEQRADGWMDSSAGRQRHNSQHFSATKPGGQQLFHFCQQSLCRAASANYYFSWQVSISSQAMPFSKWLCFASQSLSLVVIWGIAAHIVWIFYQHWSR